MKILLAEDNRFYLRLLEAHLSKWGHETVSCDEGAQAWEHLKQPNGPRVAVLDWDMPNMQGLEVCRKLRSLKDHHYVYVIVLTAKSGKNDLLEGLDAGADDYIVKPFDPFELQARLRAATRIIDLQEKMHVALRIAENRAKQDALTRLLNRSAILDALEKELERSKSLRTSLGVIMADIDHFKQINDSYGHVVGDRILFQVAATIKETLRSYDYVGRYGGDEFCLVLPKCTEEQALNLAEKVRKVVIAKPYLFNEHRIMCTISLGVTSVSKSGYTELFSVLRAADRALYEAKSRGRNCAMAQSVA